MASYANPYNRALMERQLYNNYANISRDYHEGFQQPLHGGGEFAGFGMSGGDFFSDFGDGFVKGFTGTMDFAKQLVPFLPLVGLGKCRCGECDRGCPQNCRCPRGSGMCGGDEIKDTDLLAMKNMGIPQRHATHFLGGRAPKSVPASERRMLLRKAMADARLQQELLMLMKAMRGRKTGAGMSGGDFDWSSLLSFAPLLLGLGEDGGDEVYADMMGEGFWDDVGDFFTSLPGKVADGVGTVFDVAKKGLDTLAPIAKQGKDIYDFAKPFLGEEKKGGRRAKYGLTEHGAGMSGGDFLSDLGDTFSKVEPFLPLLGLGECGGGDQSGGMFDKSKYHMMPDGSIMANSEHGAGMSGGDFLSDLGDTFSKVAPFLPLLGLGQSGGGQSGGMTYEQNMNMADAMGDIFSGEGQCGGMALNMDAPRVSIREPRLLPSSDAIQIYKGGDQCVNAPYVCDGTRIPINLQNRPTKQYLEELDQVGSGMSGGDWWSDFTDGLSSILGPVSTIAQTVAPFIGAGEKEQQARVGMRTCDVRTIGSGVDRQVGGAKKSSAWIEHVKAYARTHNIKYNEALKKAGATYRKK